MAPDIKSVELPTGVTLQYIEQGNPSCIPMLLLHGLSDSWRSYERVLPHLPESIRAFAVTQRGHGDSSRPDAGYRPHDFAADLAAFMDALQLEAAVVVGHSMSSVVVQRFAIDHPERTLGLVLIGSFVSPRDNSAVREVHETVSKLSDPLDPGLVREFQQSSLMQPVPPAFFETAVRESLKVPARVWRAAVTGLLEDDSSGEIHNIKAPTLIVWGDGDASCPRSDQETLTEAIAGSRLIVYPGTGHAPNWEEPERLAFDLVTFIETLFR